MPIKEISPNLQARGMLLLCPLSSSLPPLTTIPLSLTYFEVPSLDPCLQFYRMVNLPNISQMLVNGSKAMIFLSAFGTFC